MSIFKAVIYLVLKLDFLRFLSGDLIAMPVQPKMKLFSGLYLFIFSLIAGLMSVSAGKEIILLFIILPMLLTVSLPIENGFLETPARDINKNKGVGGRLALRFGQGFEAGGSFYSGKYDETNSKNIRFEGFDLIWVTTGWEIKGEYVRTEFNHPFLNQTLEFDGYYLTLIMFFNRFKPYFSYQYSMLPDSRLDDEQALPFNVLH